MGNIMTNRKATLTSVLGLLLFLAAADAQELRHKASQADVPTRRADGARRGLVWPGPKPLFLEMARPILRRRSGQGRYHTQAISWPGYLVCPSRPRQRRGDHPGGFRLVGAQSLHPNGAYSRSLIWEIELRGRWPAHQG